VAQAVALGPQGRLGAVAHMAAPSALRGEVPLRNSRERQGPTDPNWPIRRGLLLSALGFAALGGALLVGAMTTKNPPGRFGVTSPRGMIVAGAVAMFFMALLFLGGWWRARRFGRGGPPAGWERHSRQE